MIAHARRKLPVLVVSALLVAPGAFFAAQATAAPRQEVRRAAPARPQLAARPGTPRAETAEVWTDTTGAWKQSGIASWYGGKRWQGKLTASGVRYDENALTAAHAHLPIGSRVRVTVADTGQTVIVTINDRPGTRKRIIDLSRAAAIELGILTRGIARVHLTPG